MNSSWLSSVKFRETALVVIGAAAVVGAGFAADDLYHAVQEAEAFYSIGMNALSIEADLQDFTQESRRVFVYALTTTDPNIQLPYVNAARSADVDVNRLSAKIAALPLNAASKRDIAGFDRDWNRYVKIRNSIAGLILEDQPALAMQQERSQGAALFENCLRRLKNLKQDLDRNALEQLEAVRRTYYRCATEVGFLIVTTILFIFSLRMLAGLKRTNNQLLESENIERGRSKVLEAISRNDPLDTIMRAIAALAERRFPDGLCVITIKESESRNSFLENSGPQMYSRLAPGLNPALVLEQMKTHWSVPVQAGPHQTFGTLSFYFPKYVVSLPEDVRMMERKAQLAALAIEHVRVSAKLAFQAQHDNLTTLVNRSVLQERLAETIARSVDNAFRFALIWVDLDRFKQVNDNLGHHVGDILLQHVAKRLLGCVRDSDTVARIGGDEFVVLLPRCESAQLATDIAARIVARVAEPVVAHEHTLSVSGSVGVTLYPEHGEDAETLLRNADTAMYAAKSNGKNTFQLFDPQMGVVSAETFEIDNQLRIALDGGGKLLGRTVTRNSEFELHFQPQLDSDGLIECVEALVRWNSPILGSISPARFIPVAEENGVIVALGAWVLRQACAQASIWRRRGHRLRVAVNVSPHQFVRSDFPAAIKQVLEEYELPSEFLEIELTETALVRDLDHIVSQFEKIRRLGVRVSIDDFGTGNSSLSYLRQLPVDGLKIDRSFVSSIEFADRNTLPLVRAMIGMAHGLRLRVVAEGTETLEQLQILRREGCDLQQGYYLHRPMNAAAIDEILKDYPRAHPAFAHDPETLDLVALARVSGVEPPVQRTEEVSVKS